MRFSVFAPLLAIAAAQVTGCTSAAGVAQAKSQEINAPVVTVQNDHWLDVAVYLVNGTTRFRLGTVGAIGHETFRINSALGSPGALRLLIDPIGSQQGFTTDAFTAMPGQRIELKISSPITMSTVAVWSR